MFQSLFNKITKRVIVCPSCGQRSRVPVKPGKSLLITCPGCQNKFEIKFENPLNDVKKQIPDSFTAPFSHLNSTQKQKLQKYFPIIAGVVILLMFKTCFSQAPQKSSHPNINSRTPTTTDQQKSVFDM